MRDIRSQVQNNPEWSVGFDREKLARALEQMARDIRSGDMIPKKVETRMVIQDAEFDLSQLVLTYHAKVDHD